MSRKLVLIGAWLSVFGLLTGVGSVFLPWVRQRTGRRLEKVTVFELDQGFWYVMLLFALVAVLGAAAMGTNYARKLAGLAGPVLSVVIVTVALALLAGFEPRASAPAGPASGGQIGDSTVGSGGWLALGAVPLLGFACGLIAIGRATRHVSAPSGVAWGHE